MAEKEQEFDLDTRSNPWSVFFLIDIKHNMRDSKGKTFVRRIGINESLAKGMKKT